MDYIKKCAPILALSFAELAYYLWYSSGWFFKGEFWAETGSNYWIATQTSGFLSQMATPDYGYGVYFLRLLSYIIAKVTPAVINIADIFNLLSIAIIVVSSLSVFYYLKDKLSQVELFVLATALFLLFDFESRTFINAPYALVIPLILFIITTLDGRKPKLFEIFFYPLIIFSKPLIFPLLVPYFLALYFSKYKRLISFPVFFCVGVFEFIGLFNNENLGAIKNKFNFLKSFSDVFYYFCRFISGPNFSFNSNLIIFLMSLLGILFLFLFIIRRKYKFQIIALATLFYLVASNILMNSFVLQGWERPSDILMHLPINRHILIANISILMFLLLTINIFSKSIALKPNTVALIFASWFFASGWFAGVLSTAQNDPKLVNSSDWSAFVGRQHSVNLAMDCIPIDPLGWAVGACRSVGPNNWLAELFYSPRVIEANYIHRIEIPSAYLGGRGLCALGLMTSVLGGGGGFFEATIRASNQDIVGKMFGNGRKMSGQTVLRPTTYGCIQNAKYIDLKSSQPYMPLINRSRDFTPIFYAN